MRRRGSLSTLRWISLFFIFAAAILAALQLVRFSRVRNYYPTGQTIARVPVGGLDRTAAAERLLQTYAIPVEIHYDDAVIQIKPAVLGFELELESMLSAADLSRTSQSFWVAFWNFLWNQQPASSDVPLLYKVSDDRLRDYLVSEIAARYDQPPSAAIPVAGSVEFRSGEPGKTLDVDRAVILVKNALASPTGRVVNLSINKTASARPSLANLKILLEQIIDLDGFSGLAEMYLMDLQTGQEMQLAYDQNASVEPGIAFTAASTMKIPVMISVYRRLPEPTPQDAATLLTSMIKASDNAATDMVAQTVIDQNTAPLVVTEDMEYLGMKNTFWGGYFYNGAPLLRSFTTPANQRTDEFTDPDIYSQTVPAEIGMLLTDIYQCASAGTGTLLAAYPGEISQAECQQMVNLMAENHIGMLLQAGLPDGTRFAHKHGWVTEIDGLIHNMSDAGIVYSPGGNYVVTLYLHHPTQLLFERVNSLAARLSTAVYNYFNLPE